MNLIAVSPEAGAQPELFTARSGDYEAHGPTAGDALNRLMAQVHDADEFRMVLVRPKRGDQYFSDEQIARLRQLMAAWRAARDAESEFPPADLAELDALIAAELDANIQRSKALLRQMKS